MFSVRALLMDTLWPVGWRMRGQVRAHLVHAVLHHAFQGRAQVFQVQVMLVLSHANGLGVSLLPAQTAGPEGVRHGYVAALAHAKLVGTPPWQVFFWQEYTDAPASLIITYCTGLISFKGPRRSLGFLRPGSIFNRNQGNVIFLIKILNHLLGFHHLVLGRRGINHHCIQRFSQAVYNSQLIARDGRSGPIQGQLRPINGRPTPAVPDSRQIP